MTDVLDRKDAIKRGLRMQPGYVGTCGDTCAWIDDATAEVTSLRAEKNALLAILGTIRRECGTPWIAPEDARSAVMRLIPDAAP